jgi:ketosteroid isomerase-like protein
MRKNLLFTFMVSGLVALAPVVSGQGGTRPEAAIVTADENFNKSVAEKDRRKFLSFIADEAIFVSGDEQMRGRDAIMKGWDAFFQENGPSLEWQPTGAEVLVGGDVGHTVGRWVRRARGADGRTVQTTGQYLTVWRKQADGSWLVVYDIGSTAK